ncbi:exodeoxyribonuclease VII large subunit [Amygdalobacter nucleatus]|uniref:exodeoxyribonuclease VII large subunit n=1 Tax=Amygdalobacter nucleatus TaxID=3029274 RepID=UPI00279D2E1C|nr:exodeoxyribonuclease VII large subunit [Amygdalobacter nucleatus]WEG36606.1 exodeoxyribonuclease VII large subunit [Amygdalobacter nucleatus]
MGERVIVTVHQLNSFMTKFIGHNQSLQSFYIQGEVSGHKYYPSSGHHYFSLKDEQAQVSCVLFGSVANNLTTPIKDGDKLICLARAGFYARDGKFQLYILQVEQQGQGLLYQKFLQLKNKLAEEGLFAPEHKRPLPILPKRVAVVTSASGAVIRDIIKVGRYRYPNLDILLFPCNVQGDLAASEMLRAMQKIQVRDDISVIIIGRGGGSMEDLWCFNDEALARAIYQAKVPVVSAIGHETDFTIADFVADVRASTPSNAAELVFPDQASYLKQIAALQARLITALQQTNKIAATRLALLEKCRYLTEPDLLINERFEVVDRLKQRMLQALELPLIKQKQKLEQLTYRLKQSLALVYKQAEHSYFVQYQHLLATNPLLRLEQGYAYVSKRNGQKLSSVKQITVGELVDLQLIDGNLTCQVEAKQELNKQVN